MSMDLTGPLYALLAVECLALVMALLAGYFLMRQAVRGLKALIAFLERNKVPHLKRKRPRLSDAHGTA